MAEYDKDRQAEDQKSAGPRKPPLSKDALAREFRRLRRSFQNRRKPFPPEIPRDFLEAAQWWIRMQRPGNETYEIPRLVKVTGSDTDRWVTPYADRLCASLRAYVELEQVERKFIAAAAEDRVWYNGDNFEFFVQVYEETMNLRDIGLDAYRSEAMRNMGRLVGRFAE